MIELVKVNDNRVNGTMRDIGGDTFVCRVQYLNDLDPFPEYNVREPPRPLYHTFNATIPLSYQIAAVHRLLQAPHRLDDATLQVFKDGEYGPYLDLDSTLAEQEEDLDGLQESRKNALILRTQLPVQVHAMIEKLHNSQGKELRRHLLSLKQKFQTDKDLVHAFVANKGLDCLMDVATINDQNYIDYILRAFGQLILYVDGMHGVMRQQECVRWLYTLVGNKYRHVIKTTLELLIVYVDYAELNCLQFVDAVAYVDSATRHPPWYNVMRILQDVDASDTELLIYATTLINKCLNKIPVRDVYYDQVDALQDQGMDEIIKLYMSKQGTDLDLLRQLQIFEAVLLYEDGDESGTALQQLDDSIIKSIQKRSVNVNSSERRKSKKQQMKEKVSSPVISHSEPETKTNPRPTYLPSIIDNKENKELPTALRRRRDRFARLAHHIIQQNELLNNSNGLYNGLYGSPNSNYSSPNGTFASPNGTFASPNGTYSSPNGNFSSPNGNYSNHNGTFTSPNSTYSSLNGTFSTPNGTFSTPNGTFSSPNGTYSSPKNNYSSPNGNYSTPNGIYSSNDTLNESYTNGNYSPGSPNGNHNGINGHQEEVDCPYKSPKSSLADVLKNGTQRYTSGLKQRILNGTLGHTVTAVDALAAIRQKQLDGAVETKDERGIIINREHSIKDLAQRITSPISPTTEEKQLRVGDMAGIVSKAKKELAKSQSKEIVKSPTIEKVPKVLEIKVSENDLHWEELKKSCAHRPYHLCDLDFSELQGDADDDVVFPAANAGAIPPPPPPAFFSPFGAPPPFPIPATKPVIPVETKDQNDSDSSTLKKKKTVKLFWREIHENPTPIPIRSKIGGFIWDDLPEVPLDTAILEHLFETRTNDLVIKDKLMEPKCNMILDTKRSNAINIALKKLPTPQTIKAAIMKMDTTVIGREGIEMLLTMLPTEEEKVKIQEAQYANPDLPLDRAEQFLLALASINELSSRLKLWVFKLDFENTEKEIAEPLMDLMQGIELLKANKTFKVILSTLRSVGNFLNGSPVKGFRLEYLSKVMVVKDTVHKHPLLYHICEIIISKFSDTTDFFSEVGPVIRASKVDFDELQASLASLETDCKASWDHMKRVAKHDGSQVFITKLNEFLTDAAQRIILLNEIQKKVMSRYKKLLLYLGVPLSDMGQTKPTAFLKVIAEFALEYRTTRERVLLQLEKRANHRERNKTRGKMIMNVNNYATKNGDHSADSALKELLNSDPKTVSLTDPRRKYKVNPKVKANGDVSPDDEIIESLVRSATSKRQNPVRERRRNRISDNKTFNRTLDGHQSWPGRENGPAPGSATAVQYR